MILGFFEFLQSNHLSFSLQRIIKYPIECWNFRIFVKGHDLLGDNTPYDRADWTKIDIEVFYDGLYQLNIASKWVRASIRDGVKPPQHFLDLLSGGLNPLFFLLGVSDIQTTFPGNACLNQSLTLRLIYRAKKVWLISLEGVKLLISRHSSKLQLSTKNWG